MTWNNPERLSDDAKDVWWCRGVLWWCREALWWPKRYMMTWKTLKDMACFPGYPLVLKAMECGFRPLRAWAQGFPWSNTLIPWFHFFSSLYLGTSCPKGILKNSASDHTVKLTSKKSFVISLNSYKRGIFPLLWKLTIFMCII